MRRGGMILIIVGIVLALITALAAVFILQQKPQQPAAAPGAMPTPEVPMSQVVVAVQDIPEGEAIPPDALRMEDRPTSTLPPEAVENIEEVQGKVAAVQIFRGQILQKQMLTTQEARKLLGGDAAALIPEGKVAVVVPFNRLTGVGYAIKAGDRVDLLISMSMYDLDAANQVRLPLPPCGEEECEIGAQVSRHVVQLTLQDVEVIRVGNWPYGPEEKKKEGEGAPEEATPVPQPTAAAEGGEVPPTPTPMAPDLVTVVVSQQDALVLKYAKEKNLGIELALRGLNDHNMVNTEAVTMDYMLARFNIPNPPKRPYSMDPIMIYDVVATPAAQPK